MWRKTVGQYLDREVCVVATSNLFREIAPGLLACASVFYWVATERHLVDFRTHLRHLVAGTPLVLFVGGPQADKAFDYLLDFLADKAPAPQIMTRSRKGALPECIEELLQGTWPSEDRFDDWASYLIVAEDAETEYVERVIIDVLDVQEQMMRLFSDSSVPPEE